MKSEEFYQAKKTLNLTFAEISQIMGTDCRTVAAWASSKETRQVNPIAARVMQWMLDGYRPPEWPKHKDW